MRSSESSIHTRAVTLQRNFASAPRSTYFAAHHHQPQPQISLTSLLVFSTRSYRVNEIMSLTPGSPPRTPHTPPYTPGTPHTPLTPGSRNASIPRPPSSPLRRPASQASLRSAAHPPHGSSSVTSSVVAARRTSGHGLPGSAPGSVTGLGLETGAGAGPAARHSSGSGTVPGTPQKMRARDLLRKHYGLGLGPPPPLGSGKSSQDPMDFGESLSPQMELICWILRGSMC